MSSFQLRHPRPEDVGAAARVVIEHEVALYGETTYKQSDLEAEWADLDLGQNAWVAEVNGAVAGYASLHDRGDLFRAELYVHPHDGAVAAGTLELLERVAAERGARRLQVGALDPDEDGRRLLARLGYRPVRAFREMRIELDARPEEPTWPAGLRVTPFEPDRDAHAFHAAHQEAFADHWEHRPRSFEDWHRWNVESERFDPALWCVVRERDEIAAGTINVAGLYGGGWVATLFTRRPWRGRGVGGALLQDAFVRFWDRGERSVGLGVDAESDTGAFRVYERAGMEPVLGWVMFEKVLGNAA
jgi:GNAT superfamily N-acetyltransferase